MWFWPRPRPAAAPGVLRRAADVAGWLAAAVPAVVCRRDGAVHAAAGTDRICAVAGGLAGRGSASCVPRQTIRPGARRSGLTDSRAGGDSGRLGAVHGPAGGAPGGCRRRDVRLIESGQRLARRALALNSAAQAAVRAAVWSLHPVETALARGDGCNPWRARIRPARRGDGWTR